MKHPNFRKNTPALGFYFGHAYGETGRTGGPDTTAWDHQFDLQFLSCQASPCSWIAWGNNAENPKYSGICNWDWVFETATEFATLAGPNLS